MGRIQMNYRTPYNELIAVTKSVAVSSRVWVRNGVGTATIYVPATHPDLARLVAWGNIIELTEAGVPPWIGQVVNREYDGHGFSLGLKSAEWMLQGKITGQGRVYGAAGATSAGSVAADLFYNAAIANSDHRVLRPGIFNASASVFREYNYADLLDAWQKLATDVGGDFWVDSDLYAHFTDERGSDKRGVVVLREGYNLAEVRVVENAEEVLTAAIGLGEGSTVVEKPKLLLRRHNNSFFRAKALDITGATTPEGLAETVRLALTEGAAPIIGVDAAVIMRNGTFGSFWIGDTIELVIKHPLFNSLAVKVVGIELSAQSVMRAVFQVIPAVVPTDIQPWSII